MSSRRFGVSLVEMLVLIGALTVLLVAMVVAVRPVMLAAGESHNAARIGQSLKSMVAYAADRGGEMPNPGLPGDLSRAGRCHYLTLADSPEARISTYSSFRDYWPRCMSSWMGSFNESWHAMESPSFRDREHEAAYHDAPPLYREQYPTRFIYSFTMLTDAHIWSGQGPTVSTNEAIWRDHARYVGYEMIRFPSDKGALAYLDPPAGSSGVLVAFADGSAEWLDPGSQLHEPPFWPAPSVATGVGARMPKPVLGTVDGFLGRDR